MKKIIVYILLASILITGFSGCKKEPPVIHLYGEYNHGREIYFMEEYKLWYDYYHNEGMRHLFIEDSYAGAQFLNIWMQSEDDTILDELRNDLVGTFAYAESNWEFFRLIKENCPETVFHGNDVGHQYKTIGARYLEYLEDTGMKNSEEYKIALENIEQGRIYYEVYNQIESGRYSDDYNYREEKMAENFIREFDSLKGESVMGIYGGSHSYIDGVNTATDNTSPCMANMIHQHYGDTVTMHSTQINELIDSPIHIETISVNGNDYEASYYGSCYVATMYEKYEYFYFWRLENAYEDFKDFSKNTNN
ncbi:MAG: hypothetical protein IJ306_00985, partial [Oscillospiraceae bacterium]|nr:hypothetical protein [Oscillospiraceae bacterium]